MEAYIRFLYHVGEQSLPDAFIWIYKKSEAYDPKKLFRNSNTRYGLEVLLQRYVYSVPIRFSPTPTTCSVLPFSGVKFIVSRRGRGTGDPEQGAKAVERIEASVEAKGEFVQVGL